MPSPPIDPLELAAGELGIPLPATAGLEAARLAIAERVAWLAAHEPARLGQILYRLDVDERKTKNLGPERPDLELADLIIHRQMEKEASRARFRERKEEGSRGEDRW